MTPLPPPPTFNHEFVADLPADRLAAALFTPVGAAAGCPIQSSDGGVEVRHAKTGNKTGATPEEAKYPSATRLVREEVRGAALQPCAGATTGPSEALPSSPPALTAARNSGEGDLQVTADWAGGEARFQLDEERFLAALMSELELMPVFLREPSPEFLRATERGRA